jgi:hypothetical protein
MHTAADHGQAYMQKRDYPDILSVQYFILLDRGTQGHAWSLASPALVLYQPEGPIFSCSRDIAAASSHATRAYDLAATSSHGIR